MMKIFTANSFLSIFVFASLAGCASSTSKEKMEFEIRKIWVKAGPEKPQLTNRRINRMKPVMSDNILIAGNSVDGISAFDSDSGHLIWSLRDLQGVEGGAQAFRDRVYFGASNGRFYCVNIKTGTIIWSFDSKAEILSEPSLNTDDGFIYFTNAANTLFALEASTGKQIWNFNRQDTSQFSIRGVAKPVYSNSTLIAAFSDGSVIQFKPTNGQIVWEQVLNKNKKFHDIDTNPLIIDGQVLVAGYDDKLYSLQLQTGQIQWKMPPGGYSELTSAKGLIFYPTTNSEVLAIQKDTGKIAWKWSNGQQIAGGVQIYKDMVVFGESSGLVYFLNMTTGALVGKFEPGRGVFGSVLADEKKNRIYFISNESNVYSLEAKWKSEFPFPWLKQ